MIELLLLSHLARKPQWEDEDRGSWDLETLRNEFQERLYGSNNQSKDARQCRAHKEPSPASA